MTKRLAITLVFLCSAFHGGGQNPMTDSLKSILPSLKYEKRVEVLHELITNLWLSHPDTALQYSREAIKISEILKNTRLEAISFRLMGGVYTYKGMYDSTVYFTKIAHTLSLKVNDSTLISSTYNNLGFVYYHLGSYTEALENLLKSLDVKYKIKQDYGLSSNLNNLGLVYTKLKDYNNARKYFEEAMKVSERLKDNEGKLYSSNNTGFMYLQQGNFSQSEKSFKQSLEIAELTSNRNWKATAYSGLAQTYLGMGLTDESKHKFKMALSIRNEIGDQRGLSEVFYFFSKILLSSGYLDSALYHLGVSHGIANQIQFNDQLLENFKLFKQLHLLQKQYDSAYYYQSQYIEKRNKQFAENSSRKLADIHLKIQDEETLKQLTIKDGQLKNKDIQTYFSIAIAMLILSFGLVIFSYYKKQKRLGVDLVIKNLKISNQRDEIVQKNEELVNLNIEKNNLIGIVAHDLKSPLNQIKERIGDIKLSQPETDNETAEYIQMIESSATRLTEMIGKILNVEAIDSKQLNLELERINLGTLLPDIIERFTIQAKQKQIQLHSTIEENLSVNVDKHYFEEVIENLLSNAIKFSPPEKNIYINAAKKENTALCEIRDEGPGLSEDDKKKLFGKYQRLSAIPTGNETSTGLGLSIVKKFVEVMQGKIWCDSEKGKGASFFVSFNLSTT